MTRAGSLPLGFAAHLVDAPIEEAPRPETLRAWGQVSLRVERWESPAELKELLTPWRAHSRLCRLRLPAKGDPGEALGALGEGLRVDWVVDPEAARALLAVAPSSWRPRAVIPWAAPASPGGAELTESVRRAGAAGWPVELSPEQLCAGDELLRVLDFYLFHPGLAVPVEPLNSLLIALLGRCPRSLWELWFGRAEDCFFVGDGGEVSLCASWAAQERRRYGRREDPPEVWRASRAHSELRAMLRGEALPATACGSCDARRECGGALLALVPGAPCEVFRETVARLRLAAAALGGTRRGVGRSGG
ncbi:MAG: hypothetical protein RBU30_00930 [Polyangia bacterium]|jgi:hypothetical protein|nr:hypothetical protein [Polyangia bacterium]